MGINKNEYIETSKIENNRELKEFLEYIRESSFLEEPAYYNYYGKEYSVKSAIRSVLDYLSIEYFPKAEHDDWAKADIFWNNSLDEEYIEYYEFSEEDIEKLKSEYYPYYYGTEEGYANTYNNILDLIQRWVGRSFPTLKLKPDFSKVSKEEIEEVISLKDKADEDCDYQYEYEDKAEVIAEKTGFRVEEYCTDDLANLVVKMLKRERQEA